MVFLHPFEEPLSDSRPSPGHPMSRIGSHERLVDQTYAMSIHVKRLSGHFSTIRRMSMKEPSSWPKQALRMWRYKHPTPWSLPSLAWMGLAHFQCGCPAYRTVSRHHDGYSTRFRVIHQQIRFCLSSHKVQKIHWCPQIYSERAVSNSYFLLIAYAVVSPDVKLGRSYKDPLCSRI